NDRALLDLAAPPPGVEVTPVETDLAEDPAAALGEADLVTASAFFDLCGAAWLSRFADALAAQGAALYAVLSYDGREVWSPTDALDGAVLAAFHRDQRRDKGFGPALGPDAHAKLAELMRERGYEVWGGSSDWELTPPGDAALIAELARGSAAAVRPSLGQEADAWEASRREATHALIGHRDLLALPR
ncbi:MAG: SAM-dependent methyltransferase, partial [Pseudomonadota bacterium]